MSRMDDQATNVRNRGESWASADSTPQWFAVYTTPRHEKNVSELLAQRCIEAFLPLYRTGRQWKKSCPVVLELPLFPTYVFVRIVRHARATVLGLPGVLAIVGSPREPWPLPDLEMEALRRGLALHKAEPHPYLRVGDRVRIKAGVMTGVEGVLIRKKNEFRVVLSLDTIMQSIAVEVDADDLEPAAVAAC
ncbi:MAG TPA: UpxY family transcription antiterminator [Granulicella sp.]|nr:UpxY family transcription antiterminator [Granulicella sp.]